MLYKHNSMASYQETAIITAPKEQLTLMLYNGAIKFCNQAKIAIEKKDIRNAHIWLLKAQHIIEHLQAHQDNQYAISKEYELIYDFIIYQLTASNVSKNIDDIDVALELLRELRDVWEEVIKLVKRR